MTALSLDGPRNGRPTSRDSLTLAIVEAVAAKRDADPFDLPPLGTYIDTEALATFFEAIDGGDGGSRSVSFEYDGAEVTVDDGGDVRVAPLGRRESPLGATD
ncbi:MAG: HalOD1 output domain-containing protein [Halosimplex sp.]